MAKAVCGAQRKGKPGVYCQSTLRYPNGRCRAHGGPSAIIGPANQNWTGGRYSKYVPKRLRPDFDASLNDPDRLELAGQLAALDARFSELMRGLDTDNTDASYTDLPKKWEMMERAQLAGRQEHAMQLYMEIKAGLTLAARLQSTWAEMYDVIERRRKVVESERKRMLESAELLSIGQTMALVDQLQGAVFEIVKDRATLSAIAGAFAKTLGTVPSGRGNAQELAKQSG